MASAAQRTNIEMLEKDCNTEVKVRPALSQTRLAAVRSVINEVIEEDLLLWCKQPSKVIERKTLTRLVFEQRHFGVFRNTEGENAARIVQGILELDGVTVNLNGEVK